MSRSISISRCQFFENSCAATYSGSIAAKGGALAIVLKSFTKNTENENVGNTIKITTSKFLNNKRITKTDEQSFGLAAIAHVLVHLPSDPQNDQLNS